MSRGHQRTQANPAPFRFNTVSDDFGGNTERGKHLLTEQKHDVLHQLQRAALVSYYGDIFQTSRPKHRLSEDK